MHIHLLADIQVALFSNMVFLSLLSGTAVALGIFILGAISVILRGCCMIFPFVHKHSSHIVNNGMVLNVMVAYKRSSARDRSIVAVGS